MQSNGRLPEVDEKTKMSWASPHIEKLEKGETVQFRPKGNSMAGKIENGQLVTVEPHSGDYEVGDIVLCQVMGHHYVHLIKAIKVDKETTFYQIGNNKGNTNGWVTKKKIFGKCTRVEP
jgi:phage repressor protein C with HTH and peptisase S24 domain